MESYRCALICLDLSTQHSVFEMYPCYLILTALSCSRRYCNGFADEETKAQTVSKFRARSLSQCLASLGWNSKSLSLIIYTASQLIPGHYFNVCPLESCYLKCGLWTRSIAITLELVRNGVKLDLSEALVQSMVPSFHSLNKMIRSPEELLKRKKDAQQFATILPGYKCLCSFTLQRSLQGIRSLMPQQV